MTDTEEFCCAICGGTFDKSNLVQRDDGFVCTECELAAAATHTKQPPSPTEILARRKAKRARNIVIFMTIGSILAFGGAAAVFKFKEHSGSFQQQFFDAYADAQRLAVAGKHEEALAAFQNLEAMYEKRPADFQEITLTLADARDEAKEAYIKAVDAKLKRAEESLSNSERNEAVNHYRAAREFILSQKGFTPAPEVLGRMDKIRAEVESANKKK